MVLFLSPLWPHALPLSPCSLCSSYNGLLVYGSHHFSTFALAVLGHSDTYMAPLPPLSSFCSNVSFSVMPTHHDFPIESYKHLPSKALTLPVPLTLPYFLLQAYLMPFNILYNSLILFCCCQSLLVQFLKGRDLFLVLFTDGSQGPRILPGT